MWTCAPAACKFARRPLPKPYSIRGSGWGCDATELGPQLSLRDFCDDALLYVTESERTACYAAGCACFASTFTAPAQCEEWI